MSELVTRKQLQLIHIAKAELRIADDVYREYLRRRYHVESAKELTFSQADQLISNYKRLGFQIKSKRPCSAICAPRTRPTPLPENVVLLVSPQQLSKIRILREDIVWRTWDGFERWLDKYYGIKDGMKGIKDSMIATRVIEGLKGMWKSQNKCACGLAKGERN